MCTESRLDYIGSVTIDQDWMEVAGLQENQTVDVLNLENGSRITTYAIAGERGSGVICLNGAAAHHFEPGHRVIIVVYCYITLAQKRNFQPSILLFSEHPPYKINQEEKKLQWLKEIPQYSLLPRETSKTAWNNLEALPNFLSQDNRDRILAHNWKLGCQLLWNEAELVAGLEAFMQENHVETALDVSGGNGFPALNLRRRGWNISYNDANAWMKQQVETEIKRENDQFLATMPCTQLSWQELDKVIPPDSYDLVMCRGNSLPYAMSWSVNQMCAPEEAEKVIKEALVQFRRILRPGKVLLIDKSEFESSGFYVVEKQGVVDGQKCHIHWVFINDVQSKIRRWDQYNSVGDQTTCLTLYSLLITEEMLLEWLAEAGFVSICKNPIPGENVYTVYTARKPVEQNSEYYDHQNSIYRQDLDEIYQVTVD